MILRWRNNTEQDVLGYNIYRTSADQNGFVKLNNRLIQDNVYVDENVTSGDGYYYGLTAVAACDVESKMSDAEWVEVVENNPPCTPSRPDGPLFGRVDMEYVFSTSGVDPDGDDLFYMFDWGDCTNSGWLGPFESGETCSVSHVWCRPGVFDVRVVARDLHGCWSYWSNNHTMTINNTSPEKPEKPSGNISGNVDVEYTYSTKTMDPDNDLVYYMFDWGDGSYSRWLGPFESGETCSAKHSWSRYGVYHVRVIACDVYGYKSVWSEELNVTILDVNIVKPEAGRLYVFGREINRSFFFRNTAVMIGRTEVIVEASAVAGVDHVDFYVNNRLILRDNASPFSFIWKRLFSGFYCLKAVAYDKQGNYAVDEVRVLYWRSHPLLLTAGVLSLLLFLQGQEA